MIRSFRLNGFGLDCIIMYNVRLIEPKDNAAVEQIIRSCLIEFGGDHEGTAWMDPNLGSFSEVYADELSHYWVAVDENDRVVGGTGIAPLEGKPGFAELQKMYCLSEARGTGIAYDLMKQACDFAEQHYDAIYLETLETMTRAHAFYEKWGFTRTEPLVSNEYFACDIHYVKYLKGTK